MSDLLKQVRTKLFVLAMLILLSAYFAAPQRTVSACWECVVLTGGLCVGCDPNVSSGDRICAAHQETCSCYTTGLADVLASKNKAKLGCGSLDVDQLSPSSWH